MSHEPSNRQFGVGAVEGASATKQSAASISDGGPVLPEWCDVYAGLSDQEIAELEQVILRRADFSRYCE